MKHKIGEKQQELLLRRTANQGRNAPLYAASRGRRIVLETVAGLFMGIPLGVALYFVTVAVFYPVMLCLVEIGSALPLPETTRQNLEQGLNFGSVLVVLLAILAMASGLYFTRGAIQQGYRISAWVQMPLMLAILMLLFY